MSYILCLGSCFCTGEALGKLQYDFVFPVVAVVVGEDCFLYLSIIKAQNIFTTDCLNEDPQCGHDLILCLNCLNLIVGSSKPPPR